MLAGILPGRGMNRERASWKAALTGQWAQPGDRGSFLDLQPLEPPEPSGSCPAVAPSSLPSAGAPRSEHPTQSPLPRSSDGAPLSYRESLPSIPNTFFCSYVLFTPHFSPSPGLPTPSLLKGFFCPAELGEPRLWSCPHLGVVLGIRLTMGVITGKSLYSRGLSFLTCKMDTMACLRRLL